MAAQILKLSPLLKNCRKKNGFLHSILRWNCSRRFASSSSTEEAAETISKGFHNEVKSVLRTTEVSGLYGLDALKSAKGFQTFVQDAIERSEELIARIKDLPPSAETIHAMDEISDTICTVVDSAELCRNTHPDKDYVEEANKASMKLYEYLHYLNTNHMLYNAVVKSEQQGCLKTEEAQRAAKTLRIDFEKGGIHLCKKKLERVNELNLTITQLGREFGENILRDPGQVDVYPASRIPKCLHNQLERIQRRISSDARKGFTESGFRIVTEPGILSSVLKWTPDTDIRKQAYITGHTVPKANLNVLDKLIAARHDLAQILGYKTYAEFALTSTMASSPDVVISFLHNMSNMVKKKADEELHSITEFKKQVSNKVDESVEPWDEAYYTGMMKSSACNLESAVIASYFPLSQCLEGLNIVVRSLFGASFDRVPMAPGESWHPDVQKLILHHPIEGDLGCMYLDLYVRKGKYPGCAHFAIKGGRRLSETEYQLPVVALVCNFPPPASSSQAMLNHWELETLFHEFGHAIHSLLSRTDYQHFSGTRTVIDFAETPANLFEYFAWDYRVLKQFAKHYSTGDTIPEELVLSMNKARKMFAATDLQRQIFFSMIDQTLFGEQPLHGRDTMSIVADLKEKYTSWKHVEGTHWHTRFNHLVNYGAGYYSYLYAKCFAASLWQKVFLEDPLSLETGSVLRNDIIKYGGAKDPSILLRDCLGERVLKSCPSGGIMPNKDDLLQELNL
ncbi:mitochondrial intermediate peptidase, mitochondrial [Cryptomeria japonica]|uniref:mitochondrial intermediate peptidase, mitochondrial n=1 Tax=Cryptomeria japonica TaxID=3369 RepID=UPI0027DA4851|nr:mitochondrial intermediate peptidase, mitochondrial [Cryptomeria japonica]